MKKRFLPIAIVGCLLCVVSVFAQDYFYAYYKDGNRIEFPTNNIDSVSLVRPNGTVTDACGNTYNYVMLGDRYWMTENLRCNKTTDGKELRFNVMPTDDKRLDFGQHGNNPPECYDLKSMLTFAEKLDYNTDYLQDMTPELIEKAGFLYCTSSSLCPEGWRLPTKDDWQSLIDYTNANNACLRSSVGWADSFEQSNDDFGFSVLPSGYWFFEGTNVQQSGSAKISRFRDNIKELYYSDGGAVYPSSSYEYNSGSRDYYYYSFQVKNDGMSLTNNNSHRGGCESKSSASYWSGTTCSCITVRCCRDLMP